MSEKFWSGDWPNLNSISVAITYEAAGLSPLEMGILYRLVWHCASQCVHSAYTKPTGVLGFPDDDDAVCRIAGCSKPEWREAKAAVIEFFALRDGVWMLADESMVRLTKTAGRSAIPLATQAAVLNRDGRMCVYCGCTEGPFHFDHLWPVSKGGKDEEANLVTACATCNLSKGGKTLREWMEGRQ